MQFNNVATQKNVNRSTYGLSVSQASFKKIKNA